MTTFPTRLAGPKIKNAGRVWCLQYRSPGVASLQKYPCRREGTSGDDGWSIISGGQSSPDPGTGGLVGEGAEGDQRWRRKNELLASMPRFLQRAFWWSRLAKSVSEFCLSVRKCIRSINNDVNLLISTACRATKPRENVGACDIRNLDASSSMGQLWGPW